MENNKEKIEANKKDARYAPILERAGLNENEAQVYEILLDNGQLGIAKIGALAPNIKRTNLYSVLYSLRDKELIEQALCGGKINFRVNHPNELENYIEKKSEDLNVTKKEISALLPSMISNFNLAYHKPGVKIFEGEEGIEKIVADSLNSKTEIFSFVDVEAVEKYLHEVNVKYVRERERLGKKKRILVTNSEYNKEYFKKLGPEVTDVRYIDFDLGQFCTNMQIYDNKISYLTLNPDGMIGIIIEDKNIAHLNKGLFEYIWSTAKKTA